MFFSKIVCKISLCLVLGFGFVLANSNDFSLKRVRLAHLNIARWEAQFAVSRKNVEPQTILQLKLQPTSSSQAGILLGKVLEQLACLQQGGYTKEMVARKTQDGQILLFLTFHQQITFQVRGKKNNPILYAIKNGSKAYYERVKYA